MSLFQSIFVLFAIVTESRRHKCSHNEIQHDLDLRQTFVDYQNHPYDHNINPQQRRLSTTQPSPIRIRPYYDPNYISNEYLTNDQIDYIKSLISTVTRFYTQTLAVIPVENNLFIPRKCTNSYDTEFGKNCVEYLKPDQCGMVDIPSDHLSQDLLYFHPTNTTAKILPNGAGIPDTDLVIYVSYGQTTSCGESTLAWAAPCFQDQYGRPIAGTVNICPYIFEDTHFWKQDVVVLLHEITHVIVMGPELWHHFRDSNGDLVPHSDIVSTEQNDGLIYITSPTVRNFAQTHFQCSTLIGFPLENTGNSGSAGSHWDEHYGMSALMGSTIWGGLQYFSALTFSMMADSGWYYVDFKYSEPFYWGKHSGCQFFDEQCLDWATSTTNWEQYFCDSAHDNGCFYNYAAPAECEYYFHNGDLPWFLQYFTDATRGGPEAADFCPFRDPNTRVNDFENACWDLRGNTLFPMDYSAEVYGTSSRCVDVESSNGRTNGHCFRHACYGYDSVSKEWAGVEIFLDGFEHINCTQNDAPYQIYVTHKYHNALDVYIKCPDINAICGDSSKPFECFWGHWDDSDAECVCAPGYTGEFCDIEDREIDHGSEIELGMATKSPTVSPTEPISEILCVEHFVANAQINDMYVYDGIWNFYPRYRSPNSGYYVFWNIFAHWWMIYDEYDSLHYYALCNVSEFTADITDCNGEWKVYSFESDETVRERTASVTYGLCSADTPLPTGIPTLEPTTTTTESPSGNHPTTEAPVSTSTLLPTTSTTKLPTPNPAVHHQIPLPTVTRTELPSQNENVQSTPIPTAMPSVATTIISVHSREPTITNIETESPSQTGIESAEIIVTTDKPRLSTTVLLETEATETQLQELWSSFGGIGSTEVETEESTTASVTEIETTNVFEADNAGIYGKFKGMEWIKFFFEGYIGWVFVSILVVIILFLILIVVTVTSCKLLARNDGYVGVGLGGGRARAKEVFVKEPQSEDDSELYDSYYETDGTDATDEGTDADDGEESVGIKNDVQTIITSNLL